MNKLYQMIYNPKQPPNFQQSFRINLNKVKKHKICYNHNQYKVLMNKIIII